MNKELSGDQASKSSSGDVNGNSGKGFVDIEPMVQTGSNPMTTGGASQNTPAEQSLQQNNQAPTSNSNGWMPQIADDTDLIEKEWVDKAKEIVEHTLNDPHAQNEQLTGLKAEYLKKRYNKIIKPSDV